MIDTDKRPTVIDLFCGAGGLSKGFEMSGFDVLLGIDHCKSCVETFRNNHEAIGIVDDIKNVTGSDIRKHIGNRNIDVIVGGPPCQGFSIAGDMDPNDPRNSLFREFVRIVNDLKPKWFVMENVTGLLASKTSKGQEVSKIITSEFEKIGYRVKHKILTAADYGVPQKRRRVIFIGTVTGSPDIFPEPTHAENSYSTMDGKIVNRWVPVSSVLLDEKSVGKNYFHTNKMIEGFMKRKEKNQKNGKGFGWQILKPDKPSYTISARYWKDGGDALVMYSPEKVRMLTEQECARIQSFPDDYIFKGNKRERYQQIGNAVPPLLGKAIAGSIMEKLKLKIIKNRELLS